VGLEETADQVIGEEDQFCAVGSSEPRKRQHAVEIGLG
jgi:hypothetical protein